MDYLAQATGACSVYERQMKTCKSIPDLQVLHATAVKVLAGLGENLEKGALTQLIGRLAAARDHAKASLPNLGAVPSKGPESYITPQQLDILEQMMLAACVTAEELLAEFKAPKIALLPAIDWNQAVMWIKQQGSQRRGVVVNQPPTVVDPPKVAPAHEKFDKQAWIEQMARIRGSKAPLLDLAMMENDLPWK